MTEGGRSLWELYDSEVPPWQRGRTILACIALSHFVLQCLLALPFVLDGRVVRVCAFGFAAVIFWLLFYFVWTGVAWLRWLWGVGNPATGFCLLIWAWRDLSGLETLFGTMNIVIGAYLFSPSVYFFARHQKKTTHWKEALLFAAGCCLIMCNVAAIAVGFWFFLEQHRRDACHFADDAGQHIYVDQDRDWAFAHVLKKPDDPYRSRLDYFLRYIKGSLWLGSGDFASERSCSIAVPFPLEIRIQSVAPVSCREHTRTDGPALCVAQFGRSLGNRTFLMGLPAH
jgi:hypothetical protein